MGQSWEPQPGEAVVIKSGRLRDTFTTGVAQRLTARDVIVVEDLRKTEIRFRRVGLVKRGQDSWEGSYYLIRADSLEARQGLWRKHRQSVLNRTASLTEKFQRDLRDGKLDFLDTYLTHLQGIRAEIGEEPVE